MDYREESDGLGKIQVPASSLWGAQTQRSLEHFQISTEKMPWEVIKALVIIKKAAATVNGSNGEMDDEKSQAIIKAADEILAKKSLQDFPLSVWQTGSGTHSNMNVNEVLANRGSEILGGKRGQDRLIHPNDEVNLGQSSNDVFPTAMSMAAVMAVHDTLLPKVTLLRDALKEKSQAFEKIVKIGRTHLMDAVPLTLGQEFSAFVDQLDHALVQIKFNIAGMSELALGGTAVGTGLNTPPGFVNEMVKEISLQTGLVFKSAPNKFSALAGHDALIAFHGSLRSLAVILMKLANDIRLLASGPRSGLGELNLPHNEPGSSIMPGKTNPTQCEALTMACAQVMGNDVTMSIAGSSGQLQLNVFKPVIIHNILQSIRLLGDGSQSFTHYCVREITPNLKQIQKHVTNSLMLVTALSPHIGYDKAGEIAKLAHAEGLTLKEASLKLGFLTAEQFDKWVDPMAMAHPH